MPVFQYKALDANGRPSFGTIEALTRSHAVQDLNGNGVVAVSVDVKGASLWAKLNQPIKFNRGVTKKEILRLTQDLARLLKAGILVEQALSIVLETGHSNALKALLARVLKKVRDGKTLGETLLDEGRVFPNFYIQIVHAGEASGTLEGAFHRLFKLLERQHSFRASLVSALIYPAILLVLIGLTLFVVVSVVLPEFESIFASAGEKLPLATRIVMSFGSFVNGFGLLIVIALGIAIYWFHRKLGEAKFRNKFDRRTLTVKGIGPLLVKGEVAVIFRNLGSMIENGVPAADAFQLVVRGLKNKALKEDFSLAFSGMKEGERLSELFSRLAYFPKTALQLVRVGEETGQLGAMLEEAATILEYDVETTVARALAIFSPVMTLVMGAVIATIIGAVLLGIMSINELAF